MSWFRRVVREQTGKDPAGPDENPHGPFPPARVAGPEGEPDSTLPLPSGTERSAPGITTFLEGISEDGSHAVLDLGPGSESSFRMYTRFATRIRFAGLLPDPPRGRRLEETLKDLPPPGRGLYDMILLWNLLDRLTPREQGNLIGRLAKLSGPGARLYVVVDTSEEPMAPPLRFRLLDRTRVVHHPTGPPSGTRPPLLPAEVERVLAPFQVEHAFTLRKGFREYVAVRR